MLEIAHEHDLDIEGACEGQLACSTCHVIIDDEDLYEELGEPDVREEDLLDMAIALTPTSRLGCQVKVDLRMDEARIVLPKATRNFYVDGFKPKPH